MLLAAPAVINDELPPGGAHEARHPTGFERCANVAAVAQRQRADRVRAEPLRDLERRQDADRTSQTRAAGAERQQQKLEIDWFACSALRRHAGNSADTFVIENSEQVGNRRLACAGPNPDERLAFEFTPKQRTDPGAGEPKGMAGAAIERKDESIAQHLANGARLDIGALRRRAFAAPFLPIRIELAARGVFHKRSLRSR